MRRVLLFGSCAVLGCLALSTAAKASGRDPADYPLRVLVFVVNASHSPDTPKSRNSPDIPDYVDGQGIADLFENGAPRGLEFSFSCIEGMRASSGYETFPARWKKKEKTLEILVPQPGKPWNLEPCDLRAEMRNGLAFYWNDDKVREESAAAYKDWMVKHQFDPEKGKEDPVDVDPGQEGAEGTGTSSSTQR
jgi:hypothetical protein